jgi:uncharacterized protein (TIGR00369 family)
MTLQMDKKALQVFLTEHFPQVAGDYVVDEADEDRLVLRLAVDHRHLRPGNTVSGPTLFALADVAVYLAILSKIGPEALAVTTNCSIDFMRKPAADQDLICEVRILKLGRALAVGEAHIRSAGGGDLVARAGLTYSIPPKGAKNQG